MGRAGCPGARWGSTRIRLARWQRPPRRPAAPQWPRDSGQRADRRIAGGADGARLGLQAVGWLSADIWVVTSARRYQCQRAQVPTHMGRAGCPEARWGSTRIRLARWHRQRIVPAVAELHGKHVLSSYHVGRNEAVRYTSRYSSSPWGLGLLRPRGRVTDAPGGCPPWPPAAVGAWPVSRSCRC
jgi:hypothetical protein